MLKKIIIMEFEVIIILMIFLDIMQKNIHQLCSYFYYLVLSMIRKKIHTPHHSLQLLLLTLFDLMMVAQLKKLVVSFTAFSKLLLSLHLNFMLCVYFCYFTLISALFARFNLLLLF